MIKLNHLIIIVFSLGILNIKAQEDPNVGFYVDGVKVTELTCYSFEKLQLVIPYNPNYSSFDKLQIKMYSSYKKEGLIWSGLSYKDITKGNAFIYIKGKYIVYEIFSKEKNDANADGYTNDGPCTRTRLLSKGLGGGDCLYVTFDGYTISGYQEYYDQGCQCVKKSPTYNGEKLFDFKLLLQNRKRSGLLKSPDINWSEPCTYPGTKVDLNNLGK